MKTLKFTNKISILLISIALSPLLVLLANRPVGATIATNINVGDLSVLSNQQRAGAGLAPLSYNSQLTSAAYSKANHMFALNYWAHNGPDGSTPWTFINASGYSYISAGENLAKDYSSSSGVVSGWMASPTHRANLMNSSYRDVGYAIVNGTLLGAPTTLVVAMYGTPKSVTPPPAPAPVTQTTTPTSSPTSQQPSTSTSTTTATSSTSAQKTTSKNTVSKVAGEVKSNSNASQKTEAKGVVAGLTSNSTTKNGSIKKTDKTNVINILIASLGILLVSIRYTLFNRKNKNGHKYVWFKKQPAASISILILSISFVSVSLAGVLI